MCFITKFGVMKFEKPSAWRIGFFYDLEERISAIVLSLFEYKI